MIRTFIYIAASACAIVVLFEGFWYLQDTNRLAANIALSAWALAGLVSMFTKRRRTTRR